MNYFASHSSASLLSLAFFSRSRARLLALRSFRFCSARRKAFLQLLVRHHLHSCVLFIQYNTTLILVRLSGFSAYRLSYPRQNFLLDTVLHIFSGNELRPEIAQCHHGSNQARSYTYGTGFPSYGHSCGNDPSEALSGFRRFHISLNASTKSANWLAFCVGFLGWFDTSSTRYTTFY